MVMLNFSQFQLISFDCYGTLIDWESGILNVLRPVLAAHGKAIGETQILELFGNLEALVEQGPYQSYRDVLRSVVRRFGKRLGLAPSQAEIDSLPESIANWNPFPDTVAALRRLKSRYRLAIISNVDDDLFAATQQKLGVEFDYVTTAQQARGYKPSHEIFHVAQRKMNVTKENWLHAAQSVYHDVVTARQLGIASVWVNRVCPYAGGGAVKPASAKPDLDVSDMRTLADMACRNS